MTVGLVAYGGLATAGTIDYRLDITPTGWHDAVCTPDKGVPCGIGFEVTRVVCNEQCRLVTGAGNFRDQIRCNLWHECSESNMIKNCECKGPAGNDFCGASR